jgi:hypothetical protein
MTTIWAAIALAAMAATVGSLVLLHVARTGLSPLRDPVSAYGISRARGLYRAQTVATAVGAGALALAYAGATTSARPVVVSLCVLAAARLVISWFPMDAPGEARTAVGRVHDLLAFAAFAAASVSGFLGAIALASTPPTAAFASVSSALGWLMTAASALTVAAGVVRPVAGVFGLAERLIYVGMLAWMALSAVVLLSA